MDSYALYIILGFSFILHLFALWKIINFEKSRIAILNWAQRLNTDVLRIKRTFNRSQAIEYMTTACENCGNLLPENTARTHDGHWLCFDCKQKHFAPEPES